METARCGSRLLDQRRYAVRRAAVQDVLQGLEHLRVYSRSLSLEPPQPAMSTSAHLRRQALDGVSKQSSPSTAPVQPNQPWDGSLLRLDGGPWASRAACRASSSGLPWLWPICRDGHGRPGWYKGHELPQISGYHLGSGIFVDSVFFPRSLLLHPQTRRVIHSFYWC